jgi:hypothetical protein
MASKILLCTVVHWASTVRLCANLIRQEFAVAVVAPATHGVHFLRDVGARFSCSPHRGTRATIRHAIETWSPDFVVPADDPCVEILHDLADRCMTGPDAWIGRLLVRSLGDRRSFEIARGKTALIEMAAEEAIPVPETKTLTSEADLHAFCQRVGFPVVVKLDGTCGGRGVRIADRADKASRAYRELRSSSTWLHTAKRSAKYLDMRPVLDRWRRGSPAVFGQSYIDGRPANRAVVCWKGEVLAGLSVEVPQTFGVTGPATVVRVLDHPEMAKIAERLASRLGLSGFIGFDFMLKDHKAIFLEMNPRPTQICHLSVGRDSDLIGALLAQLAGARRPVGQQQPRAATASSELIALFPGELWRDPGSPFFRSAYHDVPWEDEALIERYSRPVPPEFPTWVDRLKALAALRRPRDRQPQALAEDYRAACPAPLAPIPTERLSD